LDPLEFEDAGVGGVRVPDRRGVGEKGADNGLIGVEHGLLLVTPGGAS